MSIKNVRGMRLSYNSSIRNSFNAESSPLFDPTEGETPSELRTSRSKISWLLSSCGNVCDRSHGYFRQLRLDFDDRFLLVLASTYFGVKGFVLHALWDGMLPYFKDIMHTDGAQFQIYSNVATLAFALKSAIGLLSDCIPIRGYHKKYYIMLSCIVGVLCLLMIVILPENYPMIASILFLLGALYAATADQLVEGKYTEQMAAVPSSGSSLVTFVWGCINLGGLAVSCVIGPVGDNWNPRYIFLIAIPFALQLFFPIMSGWLFETPREDGRGTYVRPHRSILILTVCMTIFVLGFLVAALLGDTYQRLGYTLISSVILCLIMHFHYPTTLARANLYMFLKEALYIQMAGALDYFYLADEVCLPGGPAFSYTYYQTFTQIVGYVASALGVVAFQTFFGRSKFRTAFYVVIGIKILASLFDIWIVTRANRAMGIPDQVAYMLGDAIIQPAVQMMDFMPAVVLTSKLCPKGFEASVFALLASFSNYGQNVSRSLGGIMMNWFNIKTKAPCDFSNLPMMLAVGHVFLPLLSIPLAYVLIPEASMTDTMEEYTEGFVKLDTENNYQRQEASAILSK